MPTLDLSQEYHVFDNPEVLILTNVDNATVTTSYGFRRAMTLAYTDQSGVAIVEHITRFLVWKANLSGFKPMILARLSIMSTALITLEIENTTDWIAPKRVKYE